MIKKEIHIQDLIKLNYPAEDFEFTDLEIEKESKEYNACRFLLNKFKIICRTAKITPAKTGQFVTIWKRVENNVIQPFHISDDFDFIFIIAKDKLHFGYFAFPKEALVRHKIVSTNLKEGKRGIRVYPPWSEPTNKQAQRTQKWQLEFFISSNPDKGDTLLKFLNQISNKVP